jgi:hypothetical protein
MDNRKIRIFIIENNPYHHQFEGWNEKLNKEDIIYLTENDYYTLKNRCNLWESLNEVLSEESGYMNGPTIWEDTWINDQSELFGIKEKIKIIMQTLDSNSTDLKILNEILHLVNRAFENKYWLVFDL